MNAAPTWRSSGAWIAAVLCLTFPFLWNACFPAHEEDAIAVTLSSERALRNTALPEKRVAARQLEARTEGLEARIEWEFTWDHPGRYTLHGISGFHDAAPLELVLNGEALSSMAFKERTGSRTDFERHWLATSASLRSGANRLVLEGEYTHTRIYALELRREEPLGVLRFLLLAALAAGLLGARAALVRRLRLTPGQRLAATAAATVAFLLIPIVGVTLTDGRAIADLDQSDRRKRKRLAEFEQYLASPEHAEARERSFSVCVLGDSTHFWPRPPEERMLPALRAALPAGEPIEIYGISGGAFSGYDYYLLMNRLVREAPDLVVVPVNLRSFSPWWLGLRDHDLPRIERYLRLDELPLAHGLELGDRQIRWDALALVHLDGWLFDGDFGALLRGGARYLHAERDRVLEALSERSGRQLPALLKRRERRSVWGVQDAQWPGLVESDDPALEPFRLLNRLAAKHRIPVLYYSVQANEQAQARLGIRLDLRQNYQLISAEIGRGPMVSFLDLSRENPPWMFADDSEHLTWEGMQSVAKQLARFILTRSRGSAPPTRR